MVFLAEVDLAAVFLVVVVFLAAVVDFLAVVAFVELESSAEAFFSFDSAIWLIFIVSRITAIPRAINIPEPSGVQIGLQM